MYKIKYAQSSLFTKELKEQVNTYFEENNLSKKGNWKLYIKTIFWIGITIADYITLVFFTPESLTIKLTLCAVMGIAFAGIGFNVMHDGGHGSYAKNDKWNTFSANTLNALGANAIIWDRKHNIAHHTYPNIENVDDDINVAPFLRMHKHQPWYWWYRLQIIYMWLLYCAEYVAWILIFDMKKYFSGMATSTPIKFSRSQHWVFWISKIVYAMIFIVTPIFVVGLISTIIGYSVVICVCGFLISVVFQLAHIQEKSSFPIPKATNQADILIIESDNTIHQLETTADFATKNRFISWFLGGLNFQIEHHLFPKISHVHYPAVQKIVKRVCAKYNITYNEYKTLKDAFVSHVKHMFNMGKKPKMYAVK